MELVAELHVTPLTAAPRGNTLVTFAVPTSPPLLLFLLCPHTTPVPVGVDFAIKRMVVGEHNIKLTVWDTAGELKGVSGGGDVCSVCM